MDWEYEEGVLSILEGRKGWDEELSSISKFKDELEQADLAHEKLENGWVLWRQNERQQQILTLIKYIQFSYRSWNHNLVQFWGVEKVEGQNHHLSTSNHPFCVGRDLRKGHCWFRKLCRDHVYVVDINAAEQLIGGVGRAYRNKQPESSPDLRLYSTEEFPMRDQAARCFYRSYLAVPLFDLHTDQCYGVLELLSEYTTITDLLDTLDTALQIAGFRSTHNPIVSSNSSASQTQRQHQVDSEIREILELATLTVPRLYLAQVWVPCQQCMCVNFINTNLCYMQIGSFRKGSIIDDDDDYDDEAVFDYHEACKLHYLQIDLSNNLNSNVCDVSMSISKSPLAHYAQRARLYHSLAISLQSLDNSNHMYVILFFLLQPKFREDDDACALLLRIMKMNLKTFKCVSGGRIVSESQMTNAIECESIDSLTVIKSYKQELSESDFTKYLNTVDSCCLRPSLNPYDIRQGWVFGINSNSLLVPKLLIKDKIENYMKSINIFNWIEHYRTNEYWIIQFWAPKMVEDRCYLEALDQPFVVGGLSIGLASFRKKCTTLSYYVDDQAKEEELGPPGRVFRSGHPEVTPDLFHYTTKEYPIRNYALHCCNLDRGYFAFPIFEDEHNHKSCVGVLEFVGFSHLDLQRIGRKLEEAKLCSVHTNCLFHILCGKEEALTELRNALKMIREIPQMYMVNVWIPNRQCVTSIHSNTSCMNLALSTSHLGKISSACEVDWIHVQSRKGIIGMVLASETKSCFCRNLCELSIVDQPLSHYEMSYRSEVCFAICLQSSHTGVLDYVVEFFLYQGPETYEHLWSFLNFLLPIMKHELKSFKVASGKELGDELVVEVIDFSDANSSESEQADVFPIKFRSVQYSQHREEQQMEECNVAVEHQQPTEECSVVVEHQHSEEQQKKRRTGLNLSLEVLKPHFGKKLKDVAQELGVGRSTIKRACRDYNINRWPTKEKYKRNPSLFDGKTSRNSLGPSTSNLQPLDTYTESTHHVNVEEEAEKVIIKVKYGEDITKFEFCLSLGFDKVMEEVCKRINLEKGAFKLKYTDEDGDDILLTNDADLQLCRKTQIAMNKTYIQLFVRL